MTDNLEIWNKLKQPPPTALKTINYGRLKGMSDINPMWRMEVMTEVFGPVGQGWKYTIDKLWTEQGHGGVVMAFAMVSVYFKSQNPHVEVVRKIAEAEDDAPIMISTHEWSDPVQGVGGSTLIAAESRGMHNNDEAFKMAVTDALGTALKALGVASDIYAGKWDGSKYRDHAGPNVQALKDFNGALGNDAFNAKELAQLARDNQLAGEECQSAAQFSELQAGQVLALLRGLEKQGTKEDPVPGADALVAAAKEMFDAKEVD